jgi:hypothetical protein
VRCVASPGATERSRILWRWTTRPLGLLAALVAATDGRKQRRAAPPRVAGFRSVEIRALRVVRSWAPVEPAAATLIVDRMALVVLWPAGQRPWEATMLGWGARPLWVAWPLSLPTMGQSAATAAGAASLLSVRVRGRSRRLAYSGRRFFFRPGDDNSDLATEVGSQDLGNSRPCAFSQVLGGVALPCVRRCEPRVSFLPASARDDCHD